MVVLDAAWSAPLTSLKRPFRRGVESIELMLALPVLLLVIFAGFDYGWAILRSIQLDHAARVGAREAALSGATAESIENSIRTSLNGLGMPSAVITLTPADPSAAAAGIEARHRSQRKASLRDKASAFRAGEARGPAKTFRMLV